MLQIRDICKTYHTGDLTQTALDQVSLNFRDNEFVAILGPSGSGKTTLLNIVGGLDRYDSGDLIINGISTKDYKDRDWDAYRNHTIGFVFQSYNLIPHQSVLANVELALTISGLPRSERRERARKALEEVGLGDQLHKKPNQLSGGQMQRVAIARALVNNPDILLADEPTGALDTDTGIQVMELLKEVAKDRLVIMVTHNPELAETYATRTVRLRDGKIISDTDPFIPLAGQEKAPAHGRLGKASMSFGTSLSLSFNNLRTKKARTILTAFAGSIGIIGIALIMSLSNGISTYIDDIQRETMVSYPVTIEAQSIDLSSFIGTGSSNAGGKGGDHDSDSVYANTTLLTMQSSFTTSVAENNLTAFKAYLDDPDSPIHEYIGENGIVYSYDLSYSIYAYDTEDVLVNTDGSTLSATNTAAALASAMSNSMTSANSTTTMSSSDLAGTTSTNFEELMPGQNGDLVSSAVTDNYDLVYGSWPESYDEVLLVLDSHNEISATTLYQLGFLPSSEYQEMMENIENGEEISLSEECFSYEDLASQSFYLIPACDTYTELSNGLFAAVDTSSSSAIQDLLDDAIELKIVGIIRPAEDADYASISTAVVYTNALTSYLMDYTDNSPVVQAQMDNPEVNILTGISFDEDSTYGTYDDMLALFGVVSTEAPSAINIYADSFEDKESISDCIEAYNETAEEADQITYTDYVALLMSSVTTIINVISYILIAFVAVSLVVSSIMIGIITYISVLERTKEIGILRSIGASKHNISQVFNAETFIIGLCSGVLGILVAVLLLIPVNAIIHALTGLTTVNAILPVGGAVILIVLSVILTLLGGFIPAKKAARKDPVTALRTE